MVLTKNLPLADQSGQIQSACSMYTHTMLHRNVTLQACNAQLHTTQS